MLRRMLKFQDLGYIRICNSQGISDVPKVEEDKANSRNRNMQLTILCSYSTDYGRRNHTKIILDPFVIN